MLGAAAVDEVTPVSSGSAAIVSVTEPGAAFDLIICDLQMPGMDGIETMRELAALGIQAAVLITSVEEEHAIDAAELFLLYQPKIHIRSGAFVGAEALVRWRHPALGVLEPPAFVHIAEESDALIGRLTNFALDEALTLIGHWRQDGHDQSVSVNLPSRAFEVLDLPEHLAAMVDAHHVDPKALTIEVSEVQLTVDSIRTRDVRTRLRLRRFGIALDNFGRGASGLHRLHQTPFTEIKIDQEFVHGCASSPAKRSVVEASLAMARSLGVTSVGEGVSDRADWTLLEQLGCDQAKGFFIARPMPEHGFEAWAAQWMIRG